MTLPALGPLLAAAALTGVLAGQLSGFWQPPTRSVALAASPPVRAAVEAPPAGTLPPRLTPENAQRLENLAELDLPSPGASLLALSQQAPLLAAADPGGTIQIVRYLYAGLSIVHTIQAGEPVFSLAFSPDGLWLAVGSTGAVLVYRTIDWAFYARLPADGDVTSLALVSRRLAAGTSTGLLIYWQKNLGPGFRLEQTIPLRRTQLNDQLFMAPVDSLSASQAFYRIGHGLGDGLWVLDAADGATRTRVTFQADYWIDNALTTLAFTPDGRYILCRQYGGTFTIWHISGALLRQVIVFNGPTASVAVSPDSRLAAQGGEPFSLWTIPGLEQVKPPAAVAADLIAFSPDGRYLISLSAGATLRIWGISPKGAKDAG